MRYNGRNAKKNRCVSPFMAQFLFISRLFLLFHSNMERNRTRGGFITKFHGLSQFAVNGCGSKADLIGNLPHGLVLGLEID